MGIHLLASSSLLSALEFPSKPRAVCGERFSCGARFSCVSHSFEGVNSARRPKMCSINGGNNQPGSGVEGAGGEDTELDMQANELNSVIDNLPALFCATDDPSESESAKDGDPTSIERGLGRASHLLEYANSQAREGGDYNIPRKREFCRRCTKAASKCICSRIPIPVDNKTQIIILQHPLEVNHHLGTARIAAVGLRNVELISVPEDDVKLESCRLRRKVPGSKRQIAGRGGQKAQYLAQADPKIKVPKKRPGEPKCQTEATIQVKEEFARQSGDVPAKIHSIKMATFGSTFWEQDFSSIPVPSWINLHPNAGLLFPSEHAIDLCAISPKLISEVEAAKQSEDGCRTKASGGRPPSQLIVLDGTWSKAKRIFYENPWLHSVPHYRLPPSEGASRYGFIRKEPKPGCMSTVESIVLALRTLEPDTQGLESLLDVFDSMIDDQKRCMGDKYAILEEKCRNGITQRSRILK